MTESPWWKSAVFYQIYPRSFADSSGNGVGDLRGIEQHLDHLVWLGVDAVWVSPFFRSPMKDYGYDVSDYCDVDPLFGDLADFDRLVDRAHAHGLRVMIDWVPAHTSSEHAWFREAVSDPSSPRRNFYVFRDPGPDGGPPNNWTCAFEQGRPAWALDEASGQYYLHSFLPAQPDLNWHEPAVVEAMHATLRFWLDRGVDGFRMDVIHNIGKDPDLADIDGSLAALPHMLFNDEPSTHQHLREIRKLLDGYPGERTSVGEVFLLDTAKVATYYGRDDELHMAFNFPPLYADWSEASWRKCLNDTHGVLDPIGAWPTWVLSNHDQKRHRTRYGGSEEVARAACILLLSLRGTAFIYQGEELGLLDAVIGDEQRVDPGGRDGCRAPIPWTAEPGHGWSHAPWLPFAPQCNERNVHSAARDPDGVLALYRRMLALRRASPALRLGDFRFLDTPPGVLGYERSLGAQALRVFVNFTDEAHSLLDVQGRDVRVATHLAGEGHPSDGNLGPQQAVVIDAG